MGHKADAAEISLTGGGAAIRGLSALAVLDGSLGNGSIVVFRRIVILECECAGLPGNVDGELLDVAVSNGCGKVSNKFLIVARKLQRAAHSRAGCPSVVEIQLIGGIGGGVRIRRAAFVKTCNLTCGIEGYGRNGIGGICFKRHEYQIDGRCCRCGWYFNGI